MKRTYLLLLLIASAFSFNCQKELSLDTGLQMISIKEVAPITATLQGYLEDETGQPAAGAAVSVGAKNAITDARGYFRISAAELDKNAAVVTASKPGYFTAFRSFRATDGLNQVKIQLVKKSKAGEFNSSAGGVILIPGGAQVAFTVNGMVKPDGSLYNGKVDVYAAYIDPTATNIGATVPGSFMANDINRERTVLASYGMLAVELTASNGELLQLAAGTNATITNPIPPSLLASAPTSIPLWYLDEKTGLWEEEGTAQKSGDRYIGSVKHFTYWNCDISLPSVGFSGTLATADGKPLTNVHVIVRATKSNTGYAHGYTDSLGQLSGLIPANTTLVLEVINQCGNVMFTKNIGPFNSYTNLGKLTLPNDQAGLVSISGKLTTCNNTPVKNGKAMINYGNQVTYVTANETGEFSTTLLACPGTNPVVEITGADLGVMQQGLPVTLSIDKPVVNIGNIIACGISSQEYVNYQFDGKAYSLNKIAFDSLDFFSGTGNGGMLTSLIAGHKASDNSRIQLSFEHSAVQPGTYPITSINVNEFYSSKMNTPSTVTITAFPERAGSFFEGSFSGSFKDSILTTLTHSFNGSFRIKR